jgi:GTP diphosphokinase / guanosine-3',5'-bis(diphosphate) 3'-diphosphatase
MENRESFFARLSPFMPPSELRNVEIAYMMAKFAHRAQTRTECDINGEPLRYFEHLRRVAILVIDVFGIRDWKIICAALLHDSLEDTKDITPEIVEHLFGPRVCQIVKLLSKCPKEGYVQRLRTFGDSEVLLLKGCDRLDNLRSMNSSTGEFIEKQVAETQNVLMPLWSDNNDHRIVHLRTLIGLELTSLRNKLAFIKSS